MRQSVALSLLLLVLTLTLALTSWSTPVSTHTYVLTPWQSKAASENCANSVALRKMLTAEYEEAVLFKAVSGDGQLLEIYVDLKSGAWSVVIVHPNGFSCLTSWGTGWKGPMSAEEERRASAS